MFKLVGNEVFKIGKNNAVIKIEPVGGFTYQYSLEVNGKPYQKFVEQQNKIMKTWVLPVNGDMYRIVMEKDTLDIWVNGKRADTAGEFTDDGTETHFTVAGTPAFIKAVSSGNKRVGIIHKLFVEDNQVPEYVEQ